MSDGHLWVIVRYDIENGTAIPWKHESVDVKTSGEDALDSLMSHIFSGIRDEALEVIMSDD